MCNMTVKLLESKQHKLKDSEMCAAEEYHAVYRISTVRCIISQKSTELETLNYMKHASLNYRVSRSKCQVHDGLRRPW